MTANIFTQRKLNAALQIVHKPAGGERYFLNSTGSEFRNMISSGLNDRLQKYARARQLTIAKIMMLGEKLRDAGGLHHNGGSLPRQIAATGAFWQTHKGTEQSPACHTSPALLLFDGHLPIIVPQWAGLPQHAAVAQQIILTFADCVLMPLFVNQIDQAIDESVGGAALVESMQMVQEGASARDATYSYQERMLELYRPLLEISPSELPRVLGRLAASSSAAAVGGPAPKILNPVEDEMIARLDDPNRKLIVVYEDICQTEPPQKSLENFEHQIALFIPSRAPAG
jgi:hypothetical protein